MKKEDIVVMIGIGLLILAAFLRLGGESQGLESFGNIIYVVLLIGLLIKVIVFFREPPSS